MERCAQVDIDQRVDRRGGARRERLQLGQDAGVVDEHIDVEPLDERGQRARVAQIEPVRYRAGLGCHVDQRLISEGQRVHLHPARPELAHDCFTDSPGGSRDQRGVEVHGVDPFQTITPAPLTTMFSPAMLMLSGWLR